MRTFAGSWSINLTKTIRRIKQVLKVCLNGSLYLKRWCRERELPRWHWTKLEQSGSTYIVVVFCYGAEKHIYIYIYSFPEKSKKLHQSGVLTAFTQHRLLQNCRSPRCALCSRQQRCVRSVCLERFKMAII